MSGISKQILETVKSSLGPIIGSLDPILDDFASKFASTLPSGMRNTATRSIIGVLSGYLDKISKEAGSSEISLAVTKLRDFVNFLSSNLDQGVSAKTATRKWREKYFAEMCEKATKSDNPEEVLKEVDKQIATIEALAKKILGKEEAVKSNESEKKPNALGELDVFLSETVKSWRLKQKWLS